MGGDGTSKNASRLRTFCIIWFGQLVSTLGSGVWAFALSVWVFQTTGSATQLALISFCATIPMVGSLRPSIILVGTCSFLFAQPIVNGCSQAIWLAKTPQAVQGRVFSIRRMIAWCTIPLSIGLAGPLADRVFEPLLAEGGALAASAGQVFGVGPGRGIALLWFILGVFLLLVWGVAVSIRSVRRVEEVHPDADEAAPEGAPAA